MKRDYMDDINEADKRKQICQRCHGDGEIGAYDWRGSGYITERCPTCFGKGEV